MKRKLCCITALLFLLNIILNGFTNYKPSTKNIKQIVGYEGINITNICFVSTGATTTSIVTVSDETKINEFLKLVNGYSLTDSQQIPKRNNDSVSAYFYSNNKSVMNITFSNPLKINNKYYNIVNSTLTQQKFNNFLTPIMLNSQSNSLKLKQKTLPEASTSGDLDDLVPSDNLGQYLFSNDDMKQSLELFKSATNQSGNQGLDTFSLNSNVPFDPNLYLFTNNQLKQSLDTIKQSSGSYQQNTDNMVNDPKSYILSDKDMKVYLDRYMKVKDKNNKSDDIGVSSSTAGNSSNYYKLLIEEAKQKLSAVQDELNKAKQKLNDAASAPIDLGGGTVSTYSGPGALNMENDVFTLMDLVSTYEDSIRKYQELENQAEAKGK